jgi:hypothetical protein
MTPTAGADLPEKPGYLLMLAAAPGLWTMHFVLSYVTAAVWCARYAGRDGSLASARWAIAAYTAVVLAGIVVVGWSGYRRHSHGTEALPHDSDSPGDRHRFLGFATLLLAGLSAFATMLVGWHALAWDRCF